MPLAPAATLTQIEFVGLAEQRVLVILVFNDGRSRTAYPARAPLQPEELRRAANVLNEHCRNRSLARCTPNCCASSRRPTPRSSGDAGCDFHGATVCAQSNVQEGIEYVIAGETNLMGLAELSSVDKLKRLFEAFTEKRDILHLLDQSLRADGVQIFIGHESGYQIPMTAA